MSLTALVPAAGDGLRMGGSTRKQFMLLDGLPILVHTLKALAGVESINNIIIIVPTGSVEFCKQTIVQKHGLTKIFKVIEGGSSRQESVYNGILEAPPQTDKLLIHDGVRPFITSNEINEATSALNTYEAAVVGIPLVDTPKICDNNNIIIESPDRSKLRAVQTPQLFRYKTLLAAHEIARQNNITATDDSFLVEQMGVSVKMITGSTYNIKITSKFDLLVGEAILKSRKTNKEI